MNEARRQDLISEVHEAVDEFEEIMRNVLLREKNLVKGGWKEAKITDLTRMLAQEVSELVQAIASKEPKWRVQSEAADVANTAMMIADIYKEG